MKKGELKEVFMWLSGVGYSQFDKPNENMVNVWLTILKDVPEGYALKGVQAYTSVPHPYERFPLPANIKESALSIFMKDVESEKAKRFLWRDCYDKCLAVFPGAYTEETSKCMKEFDRAVSEVRSPNMVVMLVENHVKDCERNGQINDVGTLTDYLRSLGDGYKGRDGVDRRTLNGQQAMETSKAHPSPGDAV